MTVARARIHLMVIWFLLSIPPAGIVLIQSLSGKYGSEWQDYFVGLSWLAPLLMPQIVIISTSLKAADTKKGRESRTASTPSYLICVGFSGLLGLALAVVPFSEPLLSITIKDAFLVSSFFLSVLQGCLLTAVLAFFIDI